MKSFRLALGRERSPVFKFLQTGQKNIDEVDTVTMYVGAKRQPELYAYILNLKPRRIIFNPGTENTELSALAALKGVESVDACTLVMLRTQQY